MKFLLCTNVKIVQNIYPKRNLHRTPKVGELLAPTKIEVFFSYVKIEFERTPKILKGDRRGDL